MALDISKALLVSKNSRLLLKIGGSILAIPNIDSTPHGIIAPSPWGFRILGFGTLNTLQKPSTNSFVVMDRYPAIMNNSPTAESASMVSRKASSISAM